jgi:hypothetical protein
VGKKSLKERPLENFCTILSQCSVFVSNSLKMVALTGIEPVLSALRGRRVNQLHHSAIYLEGNDLNYRLTVPPRRVDVTPCNVSRSVQSSSSLWTASLVKDDPKFS